MLSGFDLARWRPRLILLEDHVTDLAKHRYLTGAGYRLIRRFENNGWYVPRDAAISVGASAGRSFASTISACRFASREMQRVPCAGKSRGATSAVASRSVNRADATRTRPADRYGRRNGSLGGGLQGCISS